VAPDLFVFSHPTWERGEYLENSAVDCHPPPYFRRKDRDGYQKFLSETEIVRHQGVSFPLFFISELDVGKTISFYQNLLNL
jgi:hypothetical protein